MRGLDELRENLYSELEQFCDRKNMNTTELDAVRKLTETIKNLDKIIMADEYSYAGESMDGGSARGRSRGSQSGRRGGSYAGGSSAGGSYRGSYGNGSYGGGSYGDELSTKMEEMMQRASGKERSVLEEALEIIRR